MYRNCGICYTHKSELMRVTFHPYCRPKKPTDKHGTIYIRVTCQRKHIYQNTFIYLDRRFWNQKQQIVLPSCPEADGYNDLIAMELAKVRRAVIDHRLKGKPVSFADLQKLFTVGVESSELKALVEMYNKESNVSITRKRHMNTALRHAINNGVPAVIQQIKPSHIRELKIKLSKSMMKNTMLSVMKRLKSIFNFGVQNGIIEKNPMDGITLGDFETKHHYLTEKELEKIKMVFPDLSKEIQPVAKMFLFCCFTGLRFGDAMKLRHFKVVETDQGRALHFKAGKTGKEQFIPLLPEANTLLQEVVKLKYSNQYYNRCLKELGKLSGIDQPLTSHLARHTFATIGINKGIKVEIMQELLGHSDIKTTQGYAKLFNKTKWEEMGKWDK